jgi:hypothetical protein
MRTHHLPRPQQLHRDFQLHGHLPGSGVQEHSAGGLFPFVTYAQAVDGVLVHGFMAPGQAGQLVGSYDAANAACLCAKQAKEALERRQAQLSRFETSRNHLARSLS